MAERSPRGPANFRQRDVTAAIKAARQAGITRFRVEAEQGKVVVIVDERDSIPAIEAEADLAEEIRGWQP